MKKEEMLSQNVRMQFISHFTDQYDYLDSIAMALEGGCRWVQLRMKDATPEEILPIALEAQKLCKAKDATFIIDDHVELVKKIGADGVHLGKLDMPVGEARKILGDSFIIGGTSNTFEDIAMHAAAGADYIGCGPFRFTTTKKNLSPVLGLEGYQTLVAKMRENGLTLPIVAIGGINAADIPAIMRTGVSGIALSGTVLRAENPVSEMRKLMDMMV
ncbi:MAG: thiamine phosphate synthase [Paludibacteraceae bacterium]|nr:thiamine phosphate synthase [Paludibacteraceae bacterium]